MTPKDVNQSTINPYYWYDKKGPKTYNCATIWKTCSNKTTVAEWLTVQGGDARRGRARQNELHATCRHNSLRGLQILYTAR